jgi:glycyl-tRNA synthetase
LKLEIADPDTGSKNWTEVRQFNLMFGTKLGASADSAMDLYLRPETAQGIFVNFLNVQKTSRHKLPFGIAQIGKHSEMRLLQDSLSSECVNSNKWKCSFRSSGNRT